MGIYVGVIAPRLQETLLQRPMVAEAVKELLRRIRASGLRPGDKLPPQAELRSADGRGAATLDAAMAILVERGVLSRKRRVGTVVEDAEAAIPGLWTVGFAYAPEDLGPIPFTTLLSALVQSRLVQRGFSLQVFPRAGHVLHQGDRLDRFGVLPHSIADGAVDGLATTAEFDPAGRGACRAAGVPVVHIGASHRMPTASLFDRSQWLNEALAWLRGRGARRIHLVCNFRPDQDGSPWWPDLATRLGGDPIVHTRGNGHEAGMAVADDLLALAPAKRPDGLIVNDDRIASGLTLRLALAGAWRPPVAVQTCRQVPQPYGWEVAAWSSDLDSLVSTGIDLLAARILDGGLADEQRVQSLVRSDAPGAIIASPIQAAP